MTILLRLILSAALLCFLSVHAGACVGLNDPDCDRKQRSLVPHNAQPGPPTDIAVPANPGGSSGGHEGGGAHVGSSPGNITTDSLALQPIRAYLRAKDIPPAGVGAYGLVVLHSKATAANREKLKMICASYVAFFPRYQLATVPLQDQMITIWPLDNPKAKQVEQDDCDYVLEHYDLAAAEDAIHDAGAQHASFDRGGPYLVGWSPSKARGVPDALVLVVDLSADNTQADIDAKFLFWKNKIVENPSLWRHGFSIEGVRVEIHNFADQYGQAMLDAIKLVGSEK